ncbi:MAG: GAF domain-containing protein [Deltaproteobacteria bacterium]|nr:MAG: GAF domain-containing protein [Deltaproteobacteria bacterium]
MVKPPTHTQQSQREHTPSLSLHQWLRERSFSVLEVLDILKQAAELLESLHERGVIHQHITPWNLYWSPDTKTLTLLERKTSTPTESERDGLFQTTSSENSLLYISPEQTGRVSEPLDHRSDLYSLGVVGWCLLVGHPPFQSPEPQALIHAHLASRPAPPHQFRDEVPAILSELLLKLMAKRPEDRYQTALGLRLDLERCLEALEANDTISFALGLHDQFLLSLYASPLYGREQEQEKLLDALRHAQEGFVAFVFVQGPPGIGKTTLVESLLEPTYQRQGHYARGRFELLQSNIPYLAFQTALKHLLQELLTEEGPRFLYWRTRIKQSLGKTGGAALAPMLPELRYFLDDLPESPSPPPQENRIRIQNAFASLIRTLASSQHPLTLFLDDLQWADNASLELIEFLLTDPKLKGIVLVGGFRDTQEDATPQLEEFLDSTLQLHPPYRSIVLPPIHVASLEQMLNTLCHHALEKAESLAALLWEKTAGNPFFVQTLLQQIYQERLLWLTRTGWTWDERGIRQLKLTDNVASLLVTSLQQQPKETQRMLQIAACLGHRFAPAALSALLETTESLPRTESHPATAQTQETTRLHPELEARNAGQYELQLQHCVRLHLLSKEEDGRYRFVHDRVQEAAYELMSDDERAETHLLVGRYLLSQRETNTESERLYEIIGHLQQGFSEDIDTSERLAFVQLAYHAARQARRDGAFESSLGFLDWGVQRLGPNRWTEHYELTLALIRLIAEVAPGCRQREQAEEYVDELLREGKTLEEQLPGWKSKFQLRTNEHKMKEAIDHVNRFFQLTNTPLIQPFGKVKLLWELLKTLWMIGRRSPEDLEHLPKVKDTLRKGILDLQVQSSVAYSNHNPDLAPVMVLRDVQGALRHGLTGPNIQCWSGIGGVFSSILGQVGLGIRYGELGKKQLQHFNQPEIAPAIHFYITFVISPWTMSSLELSEHFRSISKQALEVGDLLTTFTSRSSAIHCRWTAGISLTQLSLEVQEYKLDLKHYQYNLHHSYGDVLEEFIALLQAESLPPQDTLRHQQESDHKNLVFRWAIPSLKLQLHLYAGRYKQAFEQSTKPKDPYMSPAMMMFIGPYWTYNLIALYHGIEQGWTTRWKCRKQLRTGRKQLTRWAKENLSSRQHRLTWIEAAKLRSQHKGFLALEQYDKACKEAREANYVQDAAFIAEQAASLCASLDHHDLAHHFRSRAIAHYREWGATAKVNQLKQEDTQLPQTFETKSLPAPEKTKGPNLLTAVPLRQFDLDAVLQASKALSQESDHNALLSRLMGLVMEQAGAERGLLFLYRQSTWELVAQSEGPDETTHILDTQVDMDAQNIDASTAMLRYTILSHEPVVLKDASQQGPFVRDSYVMAKKPRSVLCLPVLLQSHLIGLMYLENRMTAGVFTQQRQDLLSLIATQAAFSLEVLQNLSSGEYPTPASPGESATSRHATLDEPLLQIPSPPSYPMQQRDSMQGRFIGDWQIVNKIAQGGMSIVYEVYNKYTNIHGALKLMAPDNSEPQLRTRRFEREARLLDRFHHPNIISLLDADTDRVYGPFMVLEFLKGENLQSIFERHAPVPLGWWLPLAEQLCRALAVIHSEGVLHRDLKPSNVFLSPGDPFPHLTLLDFGIAEDSRQRKETRLTSTGVIVGTPAYLAPEQLKEKEAITTATDIYALGVLWFEALTGRHPMGGGSSVELFVKILQEEPDSLGKHRPEFQGTELEELLTQLLNKSPKHRPDRVDFVWDEFYMSCQFLEDPNDTEEQYPELKVEG